MAYLTFRSEPPVIGPYDQLVTHYEPTTETLWLKFAEQYRPCFTPALLGDLKQLIAELQQTRRNRSSSLPVRYLVTTGFSPEFWSLGGDLQLFSTLISRQDRTGLELYARECVDIGYHTAVHSGAPELTTINLIQGQALGGGFEAALCGNVIVAERGARFGFTESMFSLFPGMCGLTMLLQRMDPIRAERLLTNGRLYEADELHEMGLVDVLSDTGQGIETTRKFIQMHRLRRNGLLAARQARERARPINYDEMVDVAMIWVDAALRLSERELRTIKRLIRAQDHRTRTHASPVGHSQEQTELV